MSHQPVVCRPAAPLAGLREDDARSEDAKLARKLMLAEYARSLPRVAPLARDVQAVSITLADAPFSRARSLEQPKPAARQGPKLCAPQPASKATPRPSVAPPSVPAAARNAKLTTVLGPQPSAGLDARCEPIAPRHATESRPAAATTQRYDRGTRVQTPQRLTEQDRGLFTIYTADNTVHRDDVFRAVQPNFGRVQVAGDGNCGFYALLAGLIFHAVDFAGSRDTIIRRLRELGSDANACDKDFKAMAQKLRYATAREPGALQQGKQALRDLANELAQRPHHAMAYVQAHGSDFEKACYVLRATSIAAYNDKSQPLDHFALVDDDLAPLSNTFGISLVVPSVDPAITVWNPQRLRELSQVRYREGEIHLLHSQNHFDLLLPLRS
jgi:hypothetical protein